MDCYKPERIDYNGAPYEVYLTEEQIASRVREIGVEITDRFKGKRPIFIGVLNGAFIFLSDLMRHVRIPCEVDFMKLSSYGDETESRGRITELKELDADIRGRHVILVEDIVDSGLSMSYLTEKIKRIGPASLTTVALLHKSEQSRPGLQIDYVGFTIPSHFVVGYGLDYAQQGRNLVQIYAPAAG